MAVEDDCPLCARQRGGGPFVCPVIHTDDLVAVTHRATGSLGYVFTMVVGTGVAHFHEHVFVRHVGTPPDPAWDAPWSGAPTGDIDSLVDRLRARLAG